MQNLRLRRAFGTRVLSDADRNPRRSEAGVSTVEFAMTLSILLTMLFGLMELALALYSYNFISEAAREATRYAIVRGSSCSGFGSACPAAASDVQNYVVGLGYPGLDSSLLTVSTTWPAGDNNPGHTVQVKVSYQFPLTIPFIPNRTINMSSTSQMTIQQ